MLKQLVISNSKFFDVFRFSNGMMAKLNKIRNKANAINAMYLIDEANAENVTIEHIIRFTFDDVMIKLKLSTTDYFSESQMKRFCHLILSLNNILDSKNTLFTD